MEKLDRYHSLVAKRKGCALCKELMNPSRFQSGRYDSEHIGPWSIWQGSLDASIMVIGQDWGDIRYFEENKGFDAKGNPTNNTLVKLLSILGVSVQSPELVDQPQVAFFTNAILCLKEGGLQGSVRQHWFDNCADFLIKQIEIVSPKVVVTLGEKPFGTILKAFGLKAGLFKKAVESSDGFRLSNESSLFPVYHCGMRIQNTHRCYEQQKDDWQRIKTALNRSFLSTQ